jgi:acyl carrier protein
VFHAAGVLDDGLLDQQTPERLQAVLAPKWGGWRQLAAALQQQALQPELVVQFSSMAALLGSPGQSSYGAANGALDGAMAALGRPGWMSLQWGPWAGGGMAGGLEERQRQRLEGLGVRLLEPMRALESLGQLIARGASGAVGVVDADWPRLARQAGPRLGAPLELLALGAPEAAEGPPAYVAVLEGTPAAERPRLLQRFVQQQLAKVMGVSDPDQIDPGEPLFNLGLDSLMALELMVLLETNLGITLTESLVFEHPTIEALTRHFLEVLFGDAPAAAAVAAAPVASSAPAAPVASDPAWQEQLEQVAGLDEQELLRQLRGEA